MRGTGTGVWPAARASSEISTTLGPNRSQRDRAGALHPEEPGARRSGSAVASALRVASLKMMYGGIPRSRARSLRQRCSSSSASSLCRPSSGSATPSAPARARSSSRCRRRSSRSLRSVRLAEVAEHEGAPAALRVRVVGHPLQQEQRPALLLAHALEVQPELGERRPLERGDRRARRTAAAPRGSRPSRGARSRAAPPSRRARASARGSRARSRSASPPGRPARSCSSTTFASIEWGWALCAFGRRVRV